MGTSVGARRSLRTRCTTSQAASTTACSAQGSTSATESQTTTRNDIRHHGLIYDIISGLITRMASTSTTATAVPTANQARPSSPSRSPYPITSQLAFSLISVSRISSSSATDKSAAASCWCLEHPHGTRRHRKQSCSQSPVELLAIRQ